jgi:hypothetical protein
MKKCEDKYETIMKTMKPIAYELCDLQFFKLKIMAVDETKYALVG